MRRIGSLLSALACIALVATPSLAGKDTKDAMKHDMKGGKREMKMAALGGYCPVAYAAVGKALKGDPKFEVTRDGHRYLFVNADARMAYQKTPEKFVIGYDSWCATAMAMGKQVASDPTQFTVQSGTTYLFSNAEAKQVFDADAKTFVMKADAEWKKQMAMKPAKM